jgi:rhodanese-related sulfurtransferase
MTPLAFMVAAAKATIENLTPTDLAGELAQTDVLLVDVRESDETDNGIIPGARCWCRAGCSSSGPTTGPPTTSRGLSLGAA